MLRCRCRLLQTRIRVRPDRRLTPLLLLVGFAFMASHAAPARAACPVPAASCGARASGTDIALVRSVSPNKGDATGGESVVITLNVLVDPKKPVHVYFGSASDPATSASTGGGYTVGAAAPAHSPGTVDILVVGFVAITGQVFATATTASDQFTYCSGKCEQPVVTQISPPKGSAAGGQKVTVYGSHLADTSGVDFGSAIVTTFCSHTDTAVSFQVPRAVDDQPGDVPVTLLSPLGTTSPLTYTYTPDPIAGAQLSDNRSKLVGIPGNPLNLPGPIADLLPGIHGRVIDNPSLYDLFWDRNWDGNDPGFAQSAVNASIAQLAHSGYLSYAAQYGVGSASWAGGSVSAPAAICPGTAAHGFVSGVDLVLWVTCEAGGSLLAITEQPGSGGVWPLPLPDGLPMADDNTDYVVFMPQDASTGFPGFPQQCSGWQAFHAFTLVDQLTLHWALWSIPYVAPNLQTVPFIVAPVGCYTNADVAPPMSQLTENVSHELVESATDPIVGLGWVDNAYLSITNIGDFFTEGEAADVCDNEGDQSPTMISNLWVLPYWSNADRACEPPPKLVCTEAPTGAIRPVRHQPAPARRPPAANPQSMFPTALTALQKAQTFEITGKPDRTTKKTTPVARFTIWQQGTNRAALLGETYGSGGKVITRFGVIQVGGRRCVQGSHGWTCENRMPALDLRPLAARLLSPENATTVKLSRREDALHAAAHYGDAIYNGSLTIASSGRPLHLNSTIRVGAKVVGSETMSFSYSGAASKPIKLPS